MILCLLAQQVSLVAGNWFTGNLWNLSVEGIHPGCIIWVTAFTAHYSQQNVSMVFWFDWLWCIIVIIIIVVIVVVIFLIVVVVLVIISIIIILISSSITVVLVIVVGIIITNNIIVNININTGGLIEEDEIPLLTHWNHFFLALTHRWYHFTQYHKYNHLRHCHYHQYLYHLLSFSLLLVILFLGSFDSFTHHYSDVKMSQITSVSIVYSTVYSGAAQRKQQSPTSLAFVRESTGEKGSVTRNMFPFNDVIMCSVGPLHRHWGYCMIAPTSANYHKRILRIIIKHKTRNWKFTFFPLKCPVRLAVNVALELSMPNHRHNLTDDQWITHPNGSVKRNAPVVSWSEMSLQSLRRLSLAGRKPKISPVLVYS